MGLDRIQGSISIKGDKNALGLINRVNNMKELYSSLWATDSKEIASNELIVNLYEAVLKLYDQSEFTKLEDGAYYITFEMITKKKFAYYISPYVPNQDEYEVYGYNIAPFILLLKDSHADKSVDFVECDEITHQIINQTTVAKNNGKVSAAISNMIYDMTKFCVEKLHGFLTIEDKDIFIEDYVRIFVDGNLKDKVNSKQKERKKEEIKTYLSNFKKGSIIDKSLIDNNALLCSNCGSAVHIVSMYNDKRRVLRCERCRYDAEIYDKMEDSTVMLLSTAANSDTRVERMVAHRIMELLKTNGVISSESEIYAGAKNRIYSPSYKVEDVHIGNMQKKELDELIKYMMELLHANKKKINTRVALTKTAYSWIKRNLGSKALKEITVYVKYLENGLLESQKKSNETAEEVSETVEEEIEDTKETEEDTEEDNGNYLDSEQRKEFRKKRILETSKLLEKGKTFCIITGKKATVDNAFRAVKRRFDIQENQRKAFEEDNEDNDKDIDADGCDEETDEPKMNIDIDMLNQLIESKIAERLSGIEKDVEDLKKDVRSINKSITEVNHIGRIDKSLQNRVKTLNDKHDSLSKKVHEIIEFSNKEMVNNAAKNTDFSKKLLSNLIGSK